MEREEEEMGDKKDSGYVLVPVTKMLQFSRRDDVTAAYAKQMFVCFFFFYVTITNNNTPKTS